MARGKEMGGWGGGGLVRRYPFLVSRERHISNFRFAPMLGTLFQFDWVADNVIA